MEGRALVNKLIEEKIYFPKINMSYVPGTYKDANLQEVDGFEVTIATLVRLQGDNGTWYTCPVIKSWVTNSYEYNLDINSYINSLLEQAYVTSFFGVPNKSLDDVSGWPLFGLDELQVSEKERLTEFVLINNKPE